MVKLICPKCGSIHVVKRGIRKLSYSKKQRYLCTECKLIFIEDDGFKRMRYKKEVIVRAIHLHNKGLSLFDVKDHLFQHDGIKVSREAIREWCKKYSIFLKSGEQPHSKLWGINEIN